MPVGMAERVPAGEPTRRWEITRNPIYRILVKIVLTPLGVALSVFTGLLGLPRDRRTTLVHFGVYLGWNSLMLVVPRLRPPLREDPDERPPFSRAWTVVSIVSIAAVVAFLLAVPPN